MIEFKVIFPGGYNIKDQSNDNIDINVVFADKRVFFATAFTLLNIIALMQQNNHKYFWAADMFLVENLNKATIIEAISKAIADNYFQFIFSEIGTLETILGDNIKYESI